MKKFNTNKVKHKMSATQKSATWSQCNIKQHEKMCNMKEKNVRVKYAKKVHKNRAPE